MPKIVPLRVAAEASTSTPDDPDPRGMTVIGADGKVAGTVTDLWVDRSEPQIRYLEVDGRGGAGSAAADDPGAGRRASGGRSKVESILGPQFADVPATEQPDQVTLLEEDKICGLLRRRAPLRHARARSEPLL